MKAQSNDATELGSLLRTYRKQKGRSLRQLAQRVGIGKSTISRWESGSARPDKVELESLLSALALTEPDLLPFEKFLKVDARHEAEATIRRRLLRAVRMRRGLSISNAAHLIGVSKATLSRWEAGHRKPTPTALSHAVRALSGESIEVLAMSSEGGLYRSGSSSLADLHCDVMRLQDSSRFGVSNALDLEFLGLDAAIARFSTKEAKMLRLELRAAYVQWLGWWYRDAEAAEYASRLVPSLRKEPSSPMWGRVLRACANYALEYKRDAGTALQLLAEGAKALKGSQSEGFVRRELAGLLCSQGAIVEAREELRLARDSRWIEEDRSVHIYCCAMVEAATWYASGDFERAANALPDWQVPDPYLTASSAVGRARVLAGAGAKDAALCLVETTMERMGEIGLPHFADNLREYLRTELSKSPVLRV